jgi:hypothetical protein
MSLDTMPALQVTYDERQDRLEVRRAAAAAAAVYELEPGITLHYCTQTQQVVGITIRHFLQRFPLVACTLAVEDHGVAVAREYFAKYPRLPA